MKILELRFQNLNSLYGEWRIDFTHPEYVSNGIFSLTGSTGAGKSTILDAICLALYGATPRLGKITKSGNEIMSRRTGECYAEVVFESQAGRFRCHWEQRRARKKADGALQHQVHQIADADTGKLIEDKKSFVSGVIEEKTGMDFDRFTRSILLAQGGFDTFLKADVEQKSRILEQITGTGIYSEISKRVHERQRDERDKLDLLQAETSGIAILEPEQEKEIRQELEAKQKEETELAGKFTEAGKALTWLTAIDALKSEISSLSEETLKLQNDVEAFKPDRDKLGRAMKAAALDGAYATLTAVRKQQVDDREALKAEEKALPELEATVKEHETLLKSAEQQVVEAKEALKTAAPLIRKVRSLDQMIDEQKKAVVDSEKRCREDASKIDAGKQARIKERKKRSDAEKNLKLVDGYLEEYERDEWLVSGLAGIEEQLSGLLSRQKEIVQKETECRKVDNALGQAAKRFDDCAAQCRARKKELETATGSLEQRKRDLSELLGGRLLREYRTEKETLLREMAFFRKIAALEAHRAKLEDGAPCPLCGAKEHPFAEGNVPVPDETEKRIGVLAGLISKAEDQEAAIRKLEKVEAAARKKLTDSEKLEATAINEKKAAEKALDDLKNSVEKIRADFSELKQVVSAKLHPLGITEIPDDDVSSLLGSLRKRLKAWREQVKKKAGIEKRIADLDGELKRLDAVIETQNNVLGEKREQCEALKKEYAETIDERKKIYGDKKPDREESRLNGKISDAEQAEKEARKRHDDLQRKLTSTKANADSLKKRIGQRDMELKKHEEDFIADSGVAGFRGEKQFLEARLTTAQREFLSAREKELDEGVTNLKARQKDRNDRLTKELAKMMTDSTLETLQPRYKELEDFLKQLRDTVAGLKHRLAENRAAKERIKGKQAAMEAQKKECRRWEKLHGLIGSADGKKYRNFAQGLTFELMVSHANRQLEKMTDRYLLIRDVEKPLELNVIDNYQAGEIRSSRNLSGGESFIVSLTLALGLSKMASRKVRVDSLFLDEGFGSLDEEALDTALETLAGLQQDGKLIGVISHVNALKERIPTQIQVTPETGGRSGISGPGCCRKGDGESA